MLSAAHGRYTPSMTVGLSGLEQASDRALGGTPGLTLDAVDAHGPDAFLVEQPVGGVQDALPGFRSLSCASHV